MDENKPQSETQSGANVMTKRMQKNLLFDGMLLTPFQHFKKNAQERFDATRDLQTRDDDILLVAFPKTGTHWTWEIISMLINGKADYSKETKESVFLEMLPSLDMLEDIESPRILNTHFPFRWLPKKHIERGGKIVHVIRNPKDVAVSLFNHLNSGSSDPAMQIAWQHYIEYQMNSPLQIYGGWFTYEKEFEEAEKQDKNASIHTLHYENLKRNPEIEIRRLANYLGTQVSDELITDIADKTSFKKLKEADQTIKEHKEFVKNLFEMNKSKYGDMGISLKLPTIYRKGEVGDWRNYFTVAQNEQFDALFAKEMEKSDIKVQWE